MAREGCRRFCGKVGDRDKRQIKPAVTACAVNLPYSPLRLP